MDRFTILLNDDLQRAYWDYILNQCAEYINVGRTGRLIIDFQKGKINSVQNQEIFAGLTIIEYELQKQIILTRLKEGATVVIN